MINYSITDHRVQQMRAHSPFEDTFETCPMRTRMQVNGALSTRQQFDFPKNQTIAMVRGNGFNQNEPRTKEFMSD